MTGIRTKRVYEDTERGEGERILVERMWPRGLSKQDDRISRWFKEVAPTNDLRRWFHDTNDFPNFSRKYRKELTERPEAQQALTELRDLAGSADRITLVYSRKDQQHNNAVVLKDVLERELTE